MKNKKTGKYISVGQKADCVLFIYLKSLGRIFTFLKDTKVLKQFIDKLIDKIEQK